jgi:hypothetical protein
MLPCAKYQVRAQRSTPKTVNVMLYVSLILRLRAVSSPVCRDWAATHRASSSACFRSQSSRFRSFSSRGALRRAGKCDEAGSHGLALFADSRSGPSLRMLCSVFGRACPFTLWRRLFPALDFFGFLIEQYSASAGCATRSIGTHGRIDFLGTSRTGKRHDSSK